ncbi:hypothetical protein [Schaalia cardiffensis]|uniref:hypothetical protein n=1 Tax=Schaalia cardiffensis TaxID=181487 RepID=UPI0023F50E33|nr:hypothetical protein [Schaalia cardiffensis]
MTDPKHAAQQLHDLRTWSPMLATLTELTAPRSPAQTIHTKSGRTRDLGDLLAPTLDATDKGAHALRTHAQVTEWATIWASSAELAYTSHPLDALAHHSARLAEQWVDWEAFTDDLTVLHHRVARLTGHAPRTIGPCPEQGCTDTVTQAQTRQGAEGPLECPRGHTWTTLADYQQATRSADLTLIRDSTNPATRVTIAQFLQAWPELTKDDVKNWTRTHRLALTNTHPRTLNLAAGNILAKRLACKRAKHHREP